ncbi:MAG: hypothetical protein IPN33_12280 [Saprospiraceae bacterium]|nr:hypothetical protein [Saprospiraceae bacterium]
MTAQIINQKKAIELLKNGEQLSAYQVRFDEEMVEALDALLLRKNGVALPDDLVYYDDSDTDFEDDADLTSTDLSNGRLIRILKAEIPVDNEVADWVQKRHININTLLANLMTDFYRNWKTTQSK